MRSGRLRHKIQIYSIKQATGVPSTETLILFAKPWAGISPMSGKEVQALGGTTPILTTKFTMRYIHGLTSAMVIYYGGRRFKIIAPPINIDERDRELQLICTESK